MSNKRETGVIRHPYVSIFLVWSRSHFTHHVAVLRILLQKCTGWDVFTMIRIFSLNEMSTLQSTTNIRRDNTVEIIRTKSLCNHTISFTFICTVILKTDTSTHHKNHWVPPTAPCELLCFCCWWPKQALRCFPSVHELVRTLGWDGGLLWKIKQMWVPVDYSDITPSSKLACVIEQWHR